ncbi:MAG: DEAD/DEAH box helicase [Candidatus Solibacter usitatus]|nr:DEAD/DEAH box helicase [Candidatus Solibacter usitatus]
MNNFSELPLSSALQSNLARHGFVTPTPVQAQAVPAGLAGQDIVVTAQTGTGKTLAFVLPMLESLLKQAVIPGSKPEINALILSPTRELAMQIGETFHKIAAGTGIRSAVVVGGMSEQSQLLQIRKGAHVLIATPGRLEDFLERKLVKLSAVNVLVLDEADRMLDMGFLPAIKRILSVLPASRQTMCFSATMEPSVAQLINTYLKTPTRLAIGSVSKPAEHIELFVYEVEQDRKLGLLEKMLKEQHGSFLVFARTKHGADRLASKLTRGGASATAIHGNRTQGQRIKALRGFQQGEYRVLVATDVAARGIHVEGIAHVVNYDLPQVPEDFIHRVGRTGRAGHHGTASTFGTRSERGEIGKIEKLIKARLTRREVSPDVKAEQKHAIAVLPTPASKAAKPFFRDAPRQSWFSTSRRRRTA